MPCTPGRKAANPSSVVGARPDPRGSGSLAADRLPLLTYAYEPVWAIGTGRTASPDDAAQAHAVVRQEIGRCGGRADAVILYGGSVKPGNIDALLEAPGVDGVLVGGASLDPESFAAICAGGA